MAEKKQDKRPTGFRVDDKTMGQINALMKVDGSRSFQQFCERALEFYIGYLSSEAKDGYMSQVIQATLRGLFRQFESEMRRDHTKVAITVAELALAQMFTTEYTQDELSRIRGRAVDTVRRYGGPTSLGQAQKDMYELFSEGGEGAYRDS